ncbi:NAD(+)--dinitrogen-reductase ADP-D-ribosyltransferase [Vibrio diazotrophicus]|uniref:NAD(+)--dinitrogen-reductase ADP-D-ribosyltransferase n=1 Tax=Vibrio diazotrophicus TaxID=685 RepID=A0A2J8I875_VIBDI|nr:MULTISPECIES: NAD(+)--dinitrogen-reductase ADP-D-ribosyltransferase [Vibrio]MCF7362126.1 NAD(+)--dinitrogen-reductase ADP-D-ribosyltransferase [Vibrio sp. A1-b2]PNI06737.1 NAD(+)--dinitrogen-reductase ADP-D-ribosyltransferase [Vibrio diazotrophicus]
MTELHLLKPNQYGYSAGEEDILEQISLPLNHCNVPSKLLASLGYQQNPILLEIDGLHLWYPALHELLQKAGNYEQRAKNFINFMSQHFHLSCVDESVNEKTDPPPRPKLNYRRLVLGWLFDSDNEQGAAWRSWVESRFGLLTCFHKVSLHGPDTSEYLDFRKVCSRATYNTNELYAQLDLLYFFCQQELRLRYLGTEHLTLFRGCREQAEYRINGENVKLFNNLSSFTTDPESALRFGSKVFAVSVPLYKIVYFDSLLPCSLQGEQEFMVLGGLYRVDSHTL